jgi:hypothetical protein
MPRLLILLLFSYNVESQEHAPTPYSFVVFSLGFTFESFKELGAHHEPTTQLKFPSKIIFSNFIEFLMTKLFQIQ